jgi:hypothetical protein
MHDLCRTQSLHHCYRNLRSNIEQGDKAIGNIAGDGPDFRDQVLAEGAILPLTQLLDSSEHMALLRNATWALSNLCRGKSPAPNFAKLAPSIQTLARLIQRSDEEVITDACWALSYMADGDNSRIERVVQADGTVRVVRQNFALEDAIGSHAWSLEANVRVDQRHSSRVSTLNVVTINHVETLKGYRVTSHG